MCALIQIPEMSTKTHLALRHGFVMSLPFVITGFYMGKAKTMELRPEC